MRHTLTASWEVCSDLQVIHVSSSSLPARSEYASLGSTGANVRTHTCNFQVCLMTLSSLSLLSPSCSSTPLSRCRLPPHLLFLPCHWPLCSQRLLPCMCGSALGDGGRSGQPHEAALHLLHEEGGGGGHHGGGVVLQARGR